MSDERDIYLGSNPVAGTSWSDVWINALIRPSVMTFKRIVRRQDATSTRAFIWIVLSAIVAYAVLTVLQLAQGVARIDAPMVLCGFPAVAVVSVVGFAICSGITHVIALALYGIGTYDELCFAFAAFSAPLILVLGLVSGFPALALLIIPLGIYGVVLSTVAVKATHRFGWCRAIASSTVILAALCAVFAAASAMILTFFSPAIEEVFSNISREFTLP